MYKLLLCWRYLRTRFLALACIISVTLGVATLIVVNSVMSGFSEKLRDKMHGLLADVIIESAGIEGFRDPQGKMDRIKADPFLASRIEAMSASMECFAMLQYTHPNGETVTRPVRLVGVDPTTRADLGGFSGFLMNKLNRPKADFSLPPDMEQRWRDREELDIGFQRQKQNLAIQPPAPMLKDAAPDLPPILPPVENRPNALPPPAPPTDPENVKVPQGAIVGCLIATFRTKDGQTHSVIEPGDSVVLITVKGPRLEPAYDRFIVVDYFKSDLSDYDSNTVFVDLKYLQDLRAVNDVVSNIQIKLHSFDDAQEVVDRLRGMFPLGFRIQTWMDKQGPLLAAIDVERGILNFLLFMIVAVAGFGILAIFSMIVTEKTRDIGIMKSLGASNVGVLQIFLSYGLLLGMVGSFLGTGLGLSLSHNLNEVEKFLTWLTGRKLFAPDIYNFNEIPTNIEPMMVLLVNLGAVGIAVTFSILPALRAALLHPVRALRFE